MEPVVARAVLTLRAPRLEHDEANALGRASRRGKLDAPLLVEVLEPFGEPVRRAHVFLLQDLHRRVDEAHAAPRVVRDVMVGIVVALVLAKLAVLGVDVTDVENPDALCKVVFQIISAQPTVRVP